MATFLIISFVVLIISSTTPERVNRVINELKDMEE
jgi:hypothetical protein